MARTITAFVVQRLSWEYGDDFYYRDADNDAPVLTFLDRSKAEAHRRECQWRHVEAEKINPFGYVDLSLEERSSLSLPDLLRRLHDAGMQVRGEGSSEDRRYDFWEQYEQLPEQGRRLVWDAVDRVRFFEVVEMAVDLDE